MNTPASAGLGGLRVLVTRPAHQAGTLCDAIERAGGVALRQPLLRIEAPQDIAAARRGLARAQTADDVIFTSANAVWRAWDTLAQLQLAGRLFAVGRASGCVLEAKTARPVHVPQADYSGTGLLAMPEFASPQGRRIALVTGEGGRRYLPDTLAARGADVQQVRVYRRVAVTIEPQTMAALLHESDVLVVTSGGALQHLVNATSQDLRAQLYSRPLVVPSARVVKRAAGMGFASGLLRPARMDNDAIVAALLRWVDGCANQTDDGKHE